MIRGGPRQLNAVLFAALLGAAAALGQPANVVIVDHDGSPYTRQADTGRRRAAQQFFSSHADAYDFLVVYPTFPVDFGDEVGGLHTTVRSTVRGIGRPQIDTGVGYGSPARLKGYIDVRSLAAGTPLSVGDDIGIIAHEVLHQWAASVSFRDPATGAVSQELLGKDGSHWSFFLDSEASVLYGSDWVQGASGFESAASRRRYSGLDLYLMGLLTRNDVQPFTLLRPAPGTAFTAQSLPPPNSTTIQATPTVLRVDDIIAAEGERIPSAASAQKQFRAAFVVLVPPGSTPTAAQLAHVDQVRARLVREFFFLTRGLGLLETNLVELAPPSVAQNPSVRAAVDYLVGAQLDGGLWRDDTRTTMRDTSVAVEALSAFRQLPPVALARSRALAFLDAGVPTDSDARNRRVVALADLNQPLLAAAGRGTARYSQGYGRTSLDSALSLLAESSVWPISTTSPEWQVLKGEQLESGGWASTPGGPARIEPTAHALAAMARLSDKGAAEEAAAARGVVFLRTSRRPSGLFADDRDSVSATALAIGAMAAWGRLTATEAEAARVHLLATQLANGSWNGSVSDTALATTALGKVLLPNLALSSAVLSRSTVVAGFATTATVVVRNAGLVASEATTVEVFDPSGNSIGGPMSVGSLPAGASETLQLTVSTNPGMLGTNQVSVVVDPNATTSDLQRADNFRSVGLSVIGTPSSHDLFVGERSVTFLPGQLTRSPQTILVSVEVGNAGATSVSGARVRVDSEFGSGSVEVPFVAAQSTQLVQVPVVITAATRDVEFVASAFASSGFDAIGSNNSTAAVLPLQREVAVALASIALTQSTVVQGQDAELAVLLTNLGTAEASGGVLEVDVLDAAGTVVAQLPRSPVILAVSSTSSRTLRWRANAVGAFSFVARLVMPGDTTAGDDTRVASLVVSPSSRGNLSVGAGDIVVVPSVPTATQTATVTARVLNSGALGVPSFEVVLANASTGQELVRTTVGPLAPGAFASVSGQVTPATGAAFELVWRVDTSELVDEYDESDNTAVLTVRPIALADLSVASAQFVIEPSFPRAGQVTTVSVTVTNRGGQTSSASEVRLYEGTSNGSPIGIEAIPALATGVSVERTFSWTAPTSPGTRTLIAVVNEGRAVAEETYDNNRATRTVNVQNGAFVVSEPFFSPNGDGVKDVTQVRFELAQAGTAVVRVVDSKGAVVWASGEVSGAPSGQVTWNGLTDGGVLADDGAYSMVVEADGGRVGEASIMLNTNRMLLSRTVGTPFVRANSLERGVSIPWRFGLLYERDLSLVTHLGRSEIAFIGRTSAAGQELRCAMFAESVGGGPPRIISPPGWPCRQWVEYVVGAYGTVAVLTRVDAPVALAALPDGRLAYLRFQEVASGGGTSLEVLDPASGQVTVVSTASQLRIDFRRYGNPSLPLLRATTGLPSRLVASGGSLDVIDDTVPVTEFRLPGGPSPSFVTGAPLPRPGLYCPERSTTDVFCSHYSLRTLVGDALPLSGGGVVWANQGGLLFAPSAGAAQRIIAPHPAVVDFECFSDSNGCTTGRLDTSSGYMLRMRHPSGRAISGRRIVELGPERVAFAGVASVRQDRYRYIGPGLEPVVDIGERPGIFAVDSHGAVSRLFEAPEADFYQFTNGANLAASPDGRTVAFAYSPNAGSRGLEIWLLDVSTGSTTRLTEAGTNLFASFDLQWSPDGDSITFASVPAGYRAVTTTANLAASLVAFRSPGGLGLRVQGTAQDINFESYVVKARPSGTSVVASSVFSGTTPVVDGLLGDWTPPEPGLYDLTLTVLDKAGNSRSVTTTVGWVATPALSALSAPDPYLSPNADNAKDTAQINYSFSVPHSANLVITSQSGSPVRAYPRTHLAAGSFSLVWDGRDEVGNPVLDGPYVLSAETYVVPLTVDTAPPSVAVLASVPVMTGVSASVLGSVPPGASPTITIQTLTSQVRHQATDLNFEGWVLATVDGGTLVAGVAQTQVTTTLVADQLKRGALTVIATDRAGNATASPPVQVEERVQLAALGAASVVDASAGSLFAGRILPRVDRLLPAVEPSGLAADISFVSQEWAFWVASTVRSNIASYSVAWRRRGTTAPFNVDTQIDVRTDGLIVWDARAVPPQALDIEIRATDATGRTFVAPFSFGFVEVMAGISACSKGGDRLAVSVDVALPSAASPARVNPGTRVEVLPFGSTTVVSTILLPGSATQVVGRLATWELPFQSVSGLGQCKYSLRLRGSLPSGETLIGTKEIDLCQVWASSAESVAGELVLHIEAQVPNLESVDTLARAAGSDTWRLVDTRLGAGTSLDLRIPHEAFGGCGSFELRVAAHRLNGPDVDSASTGDSLCSPQLRHVTLPCSVVSVSSVPFQGSVVDCQQQATAQSVAILARTDTGNSFQALSAWLAEPSGVKIAPLTVRGFVTGQATVSATALIDVTADGPFVVIAEAVDARGGIVRGRGPTPPVDVDGVAPSAWIDSVPSRVCAGSRVSARGSVYDRRLVSYALSISGQPGDFVESATGPLSPSWFSGSFPQTLDLGGFAAGDYFVRLAGRDAVGNSGCSVPVPVRVEGAAEIRNLAVAPPILSPDGDGIQESGEVAFTVTEPSTVRLELLSAAGGVIREISSLTAPAATTLAVPLGSLLGTPDGVYRVRATATSTLCGASSSSITPFVVDTVGPVARIDQPGPGETVFGSVAVIGQASDDSLTSVVLEVGAGAAPTVWTPAPNAAQTRGGLIGVIETSALAAGPHVIRLTVRDWAGHSAVASQAVDVTSGTLLVSATVRDPAVSPNGDGVLDSTIVSGRLGAPGDLTIDLIGAGGAVTLVASTANLPASDFVYSLSEGLLQGLTEGTYEVRVTARQGQSSEAIRSRLVVDVTPPTVTVRRPLSNDVRPDAEIEVAVVGATSWSLEAIGSSASRALRAGNADFDGVAASLGASADGPEELVLSATDAAGNRAEVRRRLIVDGTPPVVSLRKPVAGGFVRGSVRVEADVTEARQARVELFAVSGTTRSSLASSTAISADGLVAEWNTAAALDGPVTLELVVGDAAGNSTTVQRAVDVDNTPPVATLTTPSGPTLRSSFGYRGTAEDLNLDRWTLGFGSPPPLDPTISPLLSGTTNVTESSFGTPPLLPEGSFRFVLTVVDRAGNQSVAETVASLQASISPPQPPRTVQPPSGVTVTRVGLRELAVSWSPGPSPNVIGYRVRRNGQVLSTQSGLSLVDAALVDGVYRYEIAAVDDSGLESVPTPVATGSIDNGPPIALLTSPLNGASIGGATSVIGTATASFGFAGFDLELGPGAAPSSWRPIGSGATSVGQSHLGTLDTRTLGEGATYALRLTARSTSGATAQVTSTFVVDNTPPSAPVLTSATAQGRTVTLTWQLSTSSDVRGYLLLRDEEIVNAPRGTSVGDFARWLLPAAATTWADLTTDGTHRYLVIAVDEALNVSQRSNTLSVSVETRAPVATIVSPLAEALVTTQVPLLVDLSDDDGASVRFEARQQGTSTWTVLGTTTLPPFGTLFDPTRFPPARVELRAIATDLSGNEGVASATLVVRVEAPLGPIGLSAQVDGPLINLQWSAAAATSSVARYEVSGPFFGSPRVLSASERSSSITFFGSGVSSFTVEAVSFHGERWAETVEVLQYLPAFDAVPGTARAMPVALSGRGAQAGDVVTLSTSAGGVLGTGVAGGDGRFVVEATWAAGAAPLAFARAVDARGNRTAQFSVQLPPYLRALSATVSLASTGTAQQQLNFAVATTGDTTGAGLLRLYSRVRGVETSVGSASVGATSVSGRPTQFGVAEYFAALEGFGIERVVSNTVTVDVPAPTLELSLVSSPDAVALEFEARVSERAWLSDLALYRRDADGAETFVTLVFGVQAWDYQPPDDGTYGYFLVPVVFGFSELRAHASPVVSVTRTSPTPAPTALTARSTAAQTLTLEWQPALPAGHRFEVERSPEPAPYAFAPIGSTMAAHLVDAPGDGRWRYRVRARDLANGTASGWATAQTNVRPLAPSISRPTLPEVTSLTTTEVSGAAFAEGPVEVLRGQTVVGSTFVEAPAVRASYLRSLVDPAFAYQIEAGAGAVLSNDGLTAAAVDPDFSGRLAIAEVCDASGCGATTRSFAFEDSTLQFLPVLAFSPDGRSLAGIAATSSGALLYLLDLSTQTLSFPAIATEVSAPIVWSPDSRSIAFGVGSPATAVAQLDLGSGTQTEIVTLNPDETVASSAFGSNELMVAVIRSSAPGTPPRLVRAELGFGTWVETTVLSDEDLGEPSVAVRSDGTVIIAIARFDGTEWMPHVEGAASFSSAASSQAQLMAVSRAGNRVVWLDPVAETLSILDTSSGSVDEQSVGSLPAPRGLRAHGENLWLWADGPGRLVSTYDFSLTAELAPSLNLLTVHSVSLDGVVGFDAVLPGLTSTARFNDLALMSVELTPSMPAATGFATARVTISNLGNSFAFLPQARVRLTIVGTTARSVTVTAPALPVGVGVAPTQFFVPLDVSGLSGPQTLIVLLDPAQSLPDIDRSNNLFTLPFTVAPSGLPSAELSTQVQGEQLVSTVTLYNPGAASFLSVRVGIETAAGSAAASAPAENVQLAASSTHQFTRTLDLSSLPSGDYRVVASVVVAASPVSTTSVPLRLARAPVASIALAPSAPSYAASQPVVLTAAVTNLSVLDPLAGGALELIVRDEAGAEVVAVSSALPTVAPGSALTRALSLPPGSLVPGRYLAEVQLRGPSGAELSGASAQFSVVGAPALAGSIAARSPAQIRQQQPVVVDAIVRNDGNVAAVDVEAAVTLVDSTSGAVVDVQLATIGTLQAGATQAFTVTLAAPHLARTHVVVLGARFGGGAFAPIATSVLAVLDGVPPQLTVLGGSPNQVVPSPVRLRVSATDPSGVAGVAVSIDGTSTAQLSLVAGVVASGEWEVVVSGLSDGRHQFGFTAVDLAGQASLVPLLLELVVDANPPVVTVGGVTEGGRYAVSPMLTFTATDGNLVSLTATLDGVPVSSGTPVGDGAHALLITATDAAGNTTIRSVVFTVDTRGPVVLVTAPADGAVVGLPVPISYTAFDASPVTVTATLDGVGFVGSTTILSPGAHLLSVVAVDDFGNATVVTRTFSSVSRSLSVTISGVTDGSVIRGPVTPIVTFGGALTSAVTLNGATFISGTPVASEGAWVLVATASDGAQTETRTIAFIIDRTAPTLALSGVQNGAVSNQAITLVFSATDPTLDLVTASLNGTPVVTGAVVSQEGSYAWVVQASDRAGNSATATRSFIIDTTPPLIQVAGVAEGQISRVSLTPTVTVTDANPGSLVVTLDGAPFASGSPVTSEGDHLLMAVATDAAGNQTIAQRQFVIDVTPPAVTLTGVVDGAFVSGSVTVEFSATDARLASLEATLDGSPLVSGTVVVAEGLHVVRVEARDTAGNVTVATRTFTIDLTPPVLTIAGVSDGLETNQDLPITVTAAGADVLSVTLDGAPFVSGSSVSAEGPHELLAYAQDLAGNSASARVRFDLDKTPPVIVLAGVADGAVLATPVTLSFSANNRRLVAVTSSLNSTSFAGGVVADEGPHVWVVEAVDAAGNRALQQRAFTLDFTPPVIAISGVTDGLVTTSSVAIAVVVTEPNPGTVVTTVDGAPFTSGDVVSSEGAHLLRVVATDAAGLMAEREVRFTIDRTPPVLVLAGVADGEFVNRAVTLTFSATDLLPVTLVGTLDGQPLSSGDVVAAEGAHVWRVTATDAAGNTSTAQRNFTLDFTAPVVAISGVADGAIVSSPVTPIVSVTGATVVTTTLNGAPFVSGTPVAVERPATLRVDARDAAGNQTIAQVSFTLDFTPPAVRIDGVAPGATVRGPVAVTFAATDAVGVASVEGRLDGALVVSPIAVATEGAHVLTVVAVDFAGNTASLSRGFTVDSTAPVISVTGVVEGQVSTTALTPVFSATDVSAFTLLARLNGQPIVSGTTIGIPGAYTLEIVAADAAGNTATTTIRFSISGAGGAICRQLQLTAARKNSTPITTWDAQAVPVGGVRVALPNSLEVLTGGSSAVQARLSFTMAGLTTSCTYAGGPTVATLQGCVPYVAAGSVVQAERLSLSVLVGSTTSSMTEVRARMTEVQPCSGVPMVPAFNFALCAFGDVTMRGMAEIRGSAAAHGSIDLGGNAELEGDAVSGGDFRRSGSAEVEGSVWHGGLVSVGCIGSGGGRQCPNTTHVTPAPRPCECGYDVSSRLSEAAANNDNNLLLRTPALAAGLGAGGLTLKNTTVALRSGRYFFHALTLKNARVDVASGETVELFVAGNVDADASSRLPSGAEGKLLIVSGADSAAGGSVTLKPREANLRLYAPGANLSFEGRTDVVGALVARNATLQGTSGLTLSPGPQATPPPLTCQ